MDEDDLKDLPDRFRLVCRKCGSENVTVDIGESYFYSEATQVQAISRLDAMPAR
jgi:hypothetical protein